MKIRSRRIIVGRHGLASALTMTAALSASLVVGVAPAQAAAPAFGDYTCAAEPARFFQPRSGSSAYGYTELWSVSVTSPAGSANVSPGGWEKIHSFTGSGEANPVAVAARSTIAYNGGFVTYVYYSGSDGYLYEGRWAPHLTGSEWDARKVSTSAVHQYTRLAYDDGFLWGVKDGDLYKLEVAANWENATSWTKVQDSWGNPGSFFGVPGSQFAVGLTGSTGALRYMKPDGSFVTLRNSGYDTNLLAGLGDGLTYRFLSADSALKRQTIGTIDGTSTQIGALDPVNNYVTTPNTTAITAVGSQCSIDDYQIRAEMIARAQGWSNVAYSQSTTYLHASGYRRDCSGFVSMVWQLPKLNKGGPNTSELPGYSHNIGWDELKPGDALLHPGVHVRLFEGWIDGNHTTYSFYEMANDTINWRHGTDSVSGEFQPIRTDDL